MDRGAPRTCGGGGCALRLRPERKKRARVRLCAIGSALDQPPPPMCCPRAPGRDPRRSTRSVYVLWRRAQPLDVVRSPNSRNVTWYGRRRYSRTLTSGARAPITSNSHPVASASCVPSPLVSQVGSAGCFRHWPALAVGAHQGAQAEVHRLQLPRGAPRGQNGWDRTSCARRVMSVHRPPRSAGFGMDFRSAVGRLVQIHRACWTENSITFDLYREPRCFCLWCSFQDA